jgi:hypothetical protein
MLTKQDTLRLLRKINRALDQATNSLGKYGESLKAKAEEAQKDPRREAA